MSITTPELLAAAADAPLDDEAALGVELDTITKGCGEAALVSAVTGLEIAGRPERAAEATSSAALRKSPTITARSAVTANTPPRELFPTLSRITV